VPGFSWQELAGLCVGLFIVGGSVAWGLRHSRSSMDDIRRDVAAFDAVLKALETSELRVHPGPVYEHPMVGPLPAHSTLVGALDGYRIWVELHNRSSDPEYTEYVVRVRVTAPSGQAFDATAGSSALAGLDPQELPDRGQCLHAGGSGSAETHIDGRGLAGKRHDSPRALAPGHPSCAQYHACESRRCFTAAS